MTLYSCVMEFSINGLQYITTTTTTTTTTIELMKLHKMLLLFRRTCHDVLELVEMCLDFDLQGNQLRVRFNGSPIVDVSVHETSRDVVVLVTTANSVHRLPFTHPALLHSRVRHATFSTWLVLGWVAASGRINHLSM